MSLYSNILVQDSEVKPARPRPHSQTRIWFWNNAGAQSFVCSIHEAARHRARLLTEGAVVWHTEVYEY